MAFVHAVSARQGEADPLSGRLFLCAGCRDQVIVCSCCDRGQIYCAGGCAREARRRTIQRPGGATRRAIVAVGCMPPGWAAGGRGNRK